MISNSSTISYLLRWINNYSHYHFTRLNPKKKGTLQFYLPALLEIHRHPMQKEFFRSTEGFLRAGLTGHGRPGPLWKIAKMALFNPCMEYDFFLAKCLLLMHCESAILWFFPKNVPSSFHVLFKWINWIKSRIPRWNWKILFVLSSYEFLAMLEGKIGEGPFFRVQSDELTVCAGLSLEFEIWRLKVITNLISWLMFRLLFISFW